MTAQTTKQRLTIAWRRLFGNDSKKKIFAVGFNKSGTSSLDHVFKKFGLISFHGKHWRSCDNLALLRTYDCFSDGIPADLEKLDRLFPESKFILQVRDLEGWLYSRLAHIDRGKNGDASYGGNAEWEVSEHAVKSWIEQRNEHHLHVLNYFAERPNDLLVVNFIRDETAATKVCNFLGYAGEYARPQKNVSPTKTIPEQHQRLVHDCAQQLGVTDEEWSYDILCPSQLAHESGFPADTAFLTAQSTATA